MRNLSISNIIEVIPKVFASLIVISYLFVGLYVIFAETYLAAFNPLLKNIFGVIMILYSFYRGYMVYLKYYRNSHEEIF